MHVFYDLEPYICTIGGCSENLVAFPTRQLWFEHELTKHRAKTVLECHDCLRHFDTETEFLTHHKSDHLRYFSKLQLQATLSSSRRYGFFALGQLRCPLCMQSNWTSQRKFVNHLGRHMEDIALASLPTHDGSDSDAGSESESEADSQRSQRPRDSPSPFSDTTPIFEDAASKNKTSTIVQESQAQVPSAEATGNSLNENSWARSSRITAQRQNDSDSDRDTYTPVRPRRRISSQARPPGGKTPKRTRSIKNDVLGELKVSIHGPLSKPAKNASVARTRVFHCAFSHYGCHSTFASKNEWKRHVSSQHLQLGFYRCDIGFCDPEKTSSAKSRSSTGKSYNDFNRKDLFTQHHRRMHAPWGNGSREPSAKERDDFEKSLEDVRQRCWIQRRTTPQRSTCGYCRRVFEGENGWEERMEHVGKHLEGKGSGEAGIENLQEDEDKDLTDWAVKEGIVKDYGPRGFWLVGMELPEVIVEDKGEIADTSVAICLES